MGPYVPLCVVLWRGVGVVEATAEEKGLRSTSLNRRLKLCIDRRRRLSYVGGNIQAEVLYLECLLHGGKRG